MGDEVETHTRVDDAFNRKVTFLLVSLLLGSVTGFLGAIAGWIWTIAVIQTEVTALSSKMKATISMQKEISALTTQMESINKYIIQFEKQAGNINEMKGMLSALVKNSDERNVIMREEKKRNDFIFGEQKRRRPLIDEVMPHITNDKIHKR